METIRENWELGLGEARDDGDGEHGVEREKKTPQCERETLHDK